MSAKRSFDVRRKAPARPAKAKTTRRAPSRPKPVAKRRSPLAVRRREAKGKMFGLFVLLALIVAGGIVYVFWRPEIRIHEVTSEDPELVAIAQTELEGTYLHILPRDSIFFFPERDIRAAVLEARPEVSALSVSRTGLTSISIETIERTAAFWWCGTPDNASAGNVSCYEADAEGFIFRPVIVLESPEGNTVPTDSALRIYAALVDATSSPAYPLRARMESLDRIPDVLRFVKAMKALGVSPVSLAIRGDEADLYIPSSGRGTRITYVLGREEAAAALATAVFPSINLTDGSVEYVDLRFSGKAYIKPRE